MGIVSQREPWSTFLPKALAVCLLAAAAVLWFQSRFMIGIDSQMVRCLPDHEFFLVDKEKLTIARDQIVAYKAVGLTPFFQDGTMMAKVIRGVPGDVLTITQEGVFINQVEISTGFPLLNRLPYGIEDLVKDEIIPPGKYFLAAPASESFDSRYWGYVDESQFIGNVTPIW